MAFMVRGWIAVCVLAVASSVRAEVLPNAVPTVMYKRWAAAHAWGLGLLRPRSEDLTSKPVFYFDFALRFRVVPTLEVGTSAGVQGRRALGFLSLYADVRYRLMAERPWNPYALLGLGIASYDPERAWVLAMRGGIGLERRFQSWAFSSELQLCRIGADPEVMPLNLRTRLAHHGGLGASVSLAAIYYWGNGGPSRRHGVP